MTTQMSMPLLRGVLALTGAAVVLLGLNAGLGGLRTLGWQDGGASFLAVTDPAVFAIHDSHSRFIGAVWGALGLVLLAAAIDPARLRQVVAIIAGAVVLGGLARLTEPSMLTSPAVLPSLVIELVGFPLLAVWTWRATRPR